MVNIIILIGGEVEKKRYQIQVLYISSKKSDTHMLLEMDIITPKDQGENTMFDGGFNSFEKY